MKSYTGQNVWDAAVHRMERLMVQGHRVVVAVSGGKDSTAAVEVCIEAAKRSRYGPIDLMFRDDEILYPGTAEYLERLAQRPEVNMHWYVNRQAAANIYNRELPFYWCFDPELPASSWVREPPPYFIEDLVNMNLYYLVHAGTFPPPEGKFILSVVGLRTEESPQRSHALHTSRSYIVNRPDYAMCNVYPIYDWRVGDVWLAAKEFGWDYNTAYDVMAKMGVSRRKQRLSQIAMSPVGAESLKMASAAWPKWWDRVTERLPGINAAARYGVAALYPVKRYDETWAECFHRTCIDNAPEWIKRRSLWAENHVLEAHAAHSSSAFPDVVKCSGCKASYKILAMALYSGDPFHIQLSWMPDAEPREFRPYDTRKWPTEKDQLRPYKGIYVKPVR